jgi:hypothetical protein
MSPQLHFKAEASFAKAAPLSNDWWFLRTNPIRLAFSTIPALRLGGSGFLCGDVTPAIG